MTDTEAGITGGGVALMIKAIISPELLEGAGSLIHGAIGAVGAIAINEAWKYLKPRIFKK